jgi:NADH:ubiquinone oxidoreductase subunit E
MLPKELRESIEAHIASVDHPRELAIDVMFALQDHFGYLSDDAVEAAAELLDMTPLEVEELATFYTFTFFVKRLELTWDKQHPTACLRFCRFAVSGIAICLRRC